MTYLDRLLLLIEETSVSEAIRRQAVSDRNTVRSATLNPWGEHQDPYTGETVVSLYSPTYPSLSVPIAGVHGAPGRCNIPTKGGHDYWFRCNGFRGHSGPHHPGPPAELADGPHSRMCHCLECY